MTAGNTVNLIASVSMTNDIVGVVPVPQAAEREAIGERRAAAPQ